MTSLAILEDRQAEVLSGGWKVKVNNSLNNSFNSINNNFQFGSILQIGSTAS